MKTILTANPLNYSKIFYICGVMQDPREDITLFRQVRDGSDKEAYRILYLRYHAALKAYASLFVGLSDAEDVVQDVLLNLWNRRAQIIINDSLASYLFHSTRNASLNRIKHDSIRSRVMTDLRLSLLDEGADYNAHQVEELKSLIRQALSELPAEQRRAFEMSRFEGKTYEQIARETGVSVKTVEYRISQALRKLEISLADYLPVYIGLITYLFATWQ